MAKVLSLFSGIDSFKKAANNLEIDYRIIGFSEIIDYAIVAHETLYKTNNLNLGDVNKINTKDVDDFDLLTYGFPCQDISKEGKMLGFEKGSETRSSVLWSAMDIARIKKPKIMIAENVKSITYKRYKGDFEKWIKHLEEMGYNNYYNTLNGENFGIPQRRKRFFLVSIRKDIDDGDFRMEFKKSETPHIDCFLENVVDDKYYLNKDSLGDLIEWGENEVKVREATKKGYKLAEVGDVINISFPNSKTRRGRVGKGVSKTLLTSCNQAVLTKEEGVLRLRKLTPLEYWRLMGFDDEDYYKVREVIDSDSKMYELAGNSIIVNQVEDILKKLERYL